MKIRLGMPNDLFPILAIGKGMHAESAFAGIPFDEKEAAHTIASFLGLNETRACFVAESESGFIQGGVLCMIVPYYFSAARYVTELALYLQPAARRGSTAMRLIRSMLAWGDERGAIQARVGVTAGINNHVASALYSRSGFEPRGTVFVKNL
jgi:GNAT superfamily N-acetyltransferase